MTRRVPAAVVAVLAAVLLLTGCSTIPVSGPVRTAPAQAEQADPGFFFQPALPEDGASPENIVRGFIQASSAGRGYTVAKQFLTTDFAKRWKHDGVLVHTAPLESSVDRDQVELRVPTSGQVDTDGVYTPSTRTVSKVFQLVQVRGQWRISDGPSEVVLSQPAFLRVYSAAYLQFFDGGFQRFVPDLRWFPVRSDQVAAQAPDVVRAILEGQAGPLRTVTRTAFPDSTTLADAVRVSDGVVSVDIEVPGGQPDQRTTDRMQQQLAASVPNSVAVRLAVNGRVPPAARQSQLEQPSATDPVVLAKGRFGTLTAGDVVREDRVLGPRIVELKPDAVTYSARQNLAAVRTRGGQVVVVTRTQRLAADSRSGLVAPTVDQSGWTYSVPEDDPSGMRATSSDGRSVPVPVELGGTRVRAIDVSTDGTRMLVLVDTTSGPKAYVAGIERSAKGQPTGLTTAQYPVALDAAEAVDATWVDQSTVAVLTSGASVQNVVLQKLGGIVDTLAPLLNARRLVGATSQSDLRGFLGTGAIVRQSTSSSTSSWTTEYAASVGIDVLAVQR